MSEPRLVRLRLSTDLLLRHLLHLPSGALRAASVDVLPGSDKAVCLSLYLDYPAVPEGVNEMSPIYTRIGDVVELTRIDWLKDGVILPLAGIQEPGDA